MIFAVLLMASDFREFICKEETIDSDYDDDIEDSPMVDDKEILRLNTMTKEQTGNSKFSSNIFFQQLQ